MTDHVCPRRRLPWANLPLRAKGLVVVAIPLVALLIYFTSGRGEEHD